jgi:hypothetical protein
MGLGSLAEEPEESGKHTAQRARHSDAGGLLTNLDACSRGHSSSAVLP